MLSLFIFTLRLYLHESSLLISYCFKNCVRTGNKNIWRERRRKQVQSLDTSCFIQIPHLKN